MIENRLKDLRKMRGLSQTDLARVSGVSIATVKNTEIGKSSPTLTVLNKLAGGLGVPVAILVAELGGHT